MKKLLVSLISFLLVLAANVGNADAVADIRGKYSGSYMTVVSNCMNSSDNGTYNATILEISIPSQSGNTFNGSATSTFDFGGFIEIEYMQFSGTITETGQINGDTSHTYLDTGGVGTFTGQLDGNMLSIVGTGHDTYGDTCTYTRTMSAINETISFAGQLNFIEVDEGGGVYSGTPIGTDFFGAIDPLTASGNISNGTTITNFGCCIAAGGLGVSNNEVLNADTAAILNTLAGPMMYNAGDIVDIVDIEGDTTTSGGGLIEIGLSYIFDSNTFTNESLDNYPFDPNDILTSLFFIYESDAGGEDVYSAVGQLIEETATTTTTVPDTTTTTTTLSEATTTTVPDTTTTTTTLSGATTTTVPDTTTTTTTLSGATTTTVPDTTTTTSNTTTTTTIPDTTTTTSTTTTTTTVPDTTTTTTTLSGATTTTSTSTTSTTTTTTLPQDFIYPGSEQEVTPCDGVRLLFDEITSGGVANCSETNNPSPPSNFRFLGQTYDIDFTGGINGIVTVCFDYEETEIQGNEETIKLMHLENGGPWEDITTLVDTENNAICGEITSFSLFAIAEPQTASGSDGGGGGCFIATAAYGSYWEPHVMILRHFRDSHLLTNKPGTMFVETYYKYSPPIADYIAEHDGLRTFVRIGLAPLVGFSWLAMNFGMLNALVFSLGLFTFFIGGICILIKRGEVH